MKPLIKLLVAMIVVISGGTTHLMAQVYATGSLATASATATVITPIIIIKHVDMSFGNMAISPSAPGTVILSPTSTRTTGGGGGVTLPASAGIVSAASFTVSGQGGYTFGITLPVSCTISDGSGNSMTGDSFTSEPASSGILSSAGTRVLNIGASLNLVAGQHPGNYTNATGLPVTVNYN